MTEMTATKQAKLERIFALEDEIAYAKTVNCNHMIQDILAQQLVG